ncbi:3-oxoacyl-ACP synthase [Flagellimonas nanhaiensis]|uniref:3-oxoacyl-ACP synthase n=1 Tax=Flagellimonas nanhaiensis TaxID=2292706 RepID=A0A371JQN3_9FLAO|nr:3-oxoacyl-ACP synthase [Allomuricauda nanhaiensis]RDY59743.1 3-oxoacyl-ACP synthase [Allomuricauda nanhaiensis]
MNKEDLVKHCWKHFELKFKTVQDRMKTLQDSLSSETKSSAGDKHETGRAMVQLEQEKLSRQLLELEKTRSVLLRIDVNQKSDKISLGSLVKTDLANYFVAISSEVFKQKDLTVFCISAGSPIAQNLMGKEMGEAFYFNGQEQTILEVA